MQSILASKSIVFIFLFYIFFICAAVKFKCALIIKYTLYQNKWKKNTFHSKHEFKIKTEKKIILSFPHVILYFRNWISQIYTILLHAFNHFLFQKKNKYHNFHIDQNKKKHHIMNLFLELFIYAIYVEYNLAKISKLDFIKLFIFLHLIELIREKTKRRRTKHIHIHIYMKFLFTKTIYQYT